MPSFSIKTASLNEIELMLSWARAEDWNPGIHDAQCFQLADPNGFFMGFLDEQPIASLSTVKYSEHLCFLGLYIVRPEFRHQGYGMKIWSHGMRYVKTSCCQLDAVTAQEANYRTSGFHSTHHNMRFEFKNTNLNDFSHPHLVPARDLPFTLLNTFDQQHFGAARTQWLQCWLTQNHSLAYKKDGMILGYGVIRECANGYKIGPLFANTPSIAEALFQGLCQFAAADTSIFIDIPEPNIEAQAFAHRFGMKPIFETIRMCTSENAPAMPWKHIFGISTLELG